MPIYTNLIELNDSIFLLLQGLCKVILTRFSTWSRSEDLLVDPPNSVTDYVED